MKIKACIFTSLALVLSIAKGHAQFLSGYGVTAGGTRSTQIWFHLHTGEKETMGYRYGLNGSFFLEFFSHPNIKWISELQYNQKGAVVNMPDNPTFNIVDNSIFKSRTTYFAFNNFLKYKIEGYDFSPYVLAGPRVEYLFSSNGPVPFQKFHFGASAGMGSEFNFFDPWILILEFHFNPDLRYDTRPLEADIKNRAYELRVGFKYNLNSTKDFDACPPVYK